jgi:hypothetical protein
MAALWERMADMEEWETVLQEWFPAIIRKKNYPIKISKQYTSSQRWEIYERLTKPQRELVDRAPPLPDQVAFYRRKLFSSDRLGIC